jgi:dihydrofolate synthase / folylpolyglutamate synthase
LISWVEHQRRFSPKMSLEKVKAICEIYGNPQDSFVSIHVGGTNGKGSVTDYLKHIFIEHGYHVGTYISPFVTRFNERITYDGEDISDEDFLRYGNIILEKYPEIEAKNIELPTFFEFVTLLAYLYFKDIKNLDVVIFEVGLGGLLDATNVITPILSIITNISYDHMNVLGNTLESIAMNKLGIVKPKVALISGVKEDFLRSLFLQVTKERNAECRFVDYNQLQIEHISLQQTIFSYLHHKHITLQMLGSHQAENASLVLAAVDYLIEKSNFKLSYETCYKGLEKTHWVGRLEVVNKSPMVLLDGAHNIDGILRLGEFIANIRENKYVKLVFAVSADKEKEKMIHSLEGLVDEIVFTQFTYERSDKANLIYELSTHPNKRLSYNIDEIIAEVMTKPNELIIFAGSLYFISEVRPKFLALNQKKGE